MSYLYRVYGRDLASDTRLVDLPNGEGRADVRFTIRDDARFRKTPKWYHTVRTPSGSAFLRFAKQGDRFRVRGHGLDFLLSPDGKSILTPKPDRYLGAVFLDTVLPLAISLDGTAVLHASSVASTRGAIAFLGDTGAGKSTIAEAFTERGCKVMSDDALPLRRRAKEIVSMPGPGHLRLYRGGPNKARIRHIGASPAPLRAIMLLERRGTEIKIEDVTPSEAWRALLANSFRLALGDPARMETEMRHLHEILARVPVRRLIYPSREKALPKVVQRVGREYNIL